MRIASVVFLCALTLGVRSRASCFAEDYRGSFTLEATADALRVYTPNIDGNDSLTLVRCLACEYYPTTEFLTRYDGVGDDCKTDGYDRDRAYYAPDRVSAFVEARNATRETTLTIERFSSFELDRGRDKIFDRFYLIADAQIDERTGYATGGRIAAGPVFPISRLSLNAESRSTVPSIKGLEAFDLDDCRELGVNHAALTIDLCALVQTKDVETVEFSCCGKTYRFNKSMVDYYDAWAKKGTEYGMELTFVLVFWKSRMHLAPDWIFPDYEVWMEGPTALSIGAPDTTNLRGIERIQALFEFLGERYTRKDKRHGRVSNFVVGNELNSGYIWNNMGRLPLDETVRQYERYLRVAYTALRKYWSGANVLASFDNYWTKNSAKDFGFPHYVEKGGFSGKEYMLELARLTRAEGDYPWNVAYHPYGLDLRTPVYWDQYSTEQAEKSFDAPRITPYNCEILPQFLATEPMLCKRLGADGEEETSVREFYFTEQGFASPHDDNYGDYFSVEYDPNAIPEVWLERQCAAFALAYYKAEAIGAKAYIVHRQFDVRSEQLNIGLWARPKGQETGKGAKKPIWFLFQQIDQPGSKEKNEKYLPILRFYPHETPPQSWDELLR